jgi:hypothetical protein
MSLRVTPATTTGNSASLQVWKLTNDAPRGKLVFVDHDTLLVIAH